MLVYYLFKELLLSCLFSKIHTRTHTIILKVFCMIMKLGLLLCKKDVKYKCPKTKCSGKYLNPWS